MLRRRAGEQQFDYVTTFLSPPGAPLFRQLFETDETMIDIEPFIRDCYDDGEDSGRPLEVINLPAGEPHAKISNTGTAGRHLWIDARMGGSGESFMRLLVAIDAVRGDVSTHQAWPVPAILSRRKTGPATGGDGDMREVQAA